MKYRCWLFFNDYVSQDALRYADYKKVLKLIELTTLNISKYDFKSFFAF